MARAGKYTRLFYGGYDITADTSAVDLGGKNHDEIEASGFSQDHGYAVGPSDTTITIDGYFETDSTAALNTPSQTEHLTVAFGNNAAPTTGDVAVAIQAAQSIYRAGSDMAGLQTVFAQLRPADEVNIALEYGHLLLDATVTATGNGTSVDNGASSSAGASGYFHITGLSAGDTITLTIEDSPNDSVWSTLITCTLDGTALAAERVEVSGTVDRYLRAEYTVTGADISFPVAVAVIRN